MENERVKLEHAGHAVELVRCTVADYLGLADWSDMHLGRDYFFRRGHVEKVLGRAHNEVFAIEIDTVMSGFCIMYKGSVLHNLYLQPEYRHGGFGTVILQHLNPLRIRSKTNMLAGDPTAFYEKNGYVVDQPDPERPHILDMVHASAQTPSLKKPLVHVLNRSDGAADGDLFDSPPAAAGDGAAFTFTDCWAACGGHVATSNTAPRHPVAPQAPAVGEGGETQAAELERLRKMEKNRVRAVDYRRRKREELSRLRMPIAADAHQLQIG